MISPKDEYVKLVCQRLEENWKSFSILFSMKHYGNCISIMRQELEQSINVLFLIKQRNMDRDYLIDLAINNKKWHVIVDAKKENITEEVLRKFSRSLDGWERKVYEFGFAFKSLSVNYNYMLKNPIVSLNEEERNSIHAYIEEYHDASFPHDFTIEDVIPIIPRIFAVLSERLKKSLLLL